MWENCNYHNRVLIYVVTFLMKIESYKHKTGIQIYEEHVPMNIPSDNITLVTMSIYYKKSAILL